MGKAHLFDSIAAGIIGAALLAFTAVSLFDTDKTVSITENRELAPRPCWTLDTWLSGRFTLDYETYLSDTLPLRDGFFALSNSVNRYFKELGVTGGRWIGSRFLYRDMAMGLYIPESEAIFAFADAVGAFADAHPDLRVAVLPAPASFSFYAPDAYKSPENDAEGKYREILQALPSSVTGVDAYSALEAHRDEYIYFRTDYHWTQTGAYYAYTAFCKAVGISPAPLSDFRRAVAPYEFVGALAREMQYPEELTENPDYIELFYPDDTVTASAGDWPELIPRELCLVGGEISDGDYLFSLFMEGDHALAQINSQSDGGTLLVIKISHANPLSPFLARHYSRIIYLDPRYYKGSLSEFLNSQAVDDVLILPKMLLDSGFSEFLLS
ncbi:MAG: hypothetical protein LBC78_00885 [Oscillospiraceae bacterium]|jgi:hypothetical protein|nr:hypothetical protein [Oscillospiraceae bacterium]